jgi:hypothetical protein
LRRGKHRHGARVGVEQRGVRVGAREQAQQQLVEVQAREQRVARGHHMPALPFGTLERVQVGIGAGRAGVAELQRL